LEGGALQTSSRKKKKVSAGRHARKGSILVVDRKKSRDSIMRGSELILQGKKKKRTPVKRWRGDHKAPVLKRIEEWEGSAGKQEINTGG